MSRNYNRSSTSILNKPYQLFHRYFLSEKTPTSNLSDLNTDTNIRTTLHQLRHHNWSKGEIFHYTFLCSILLFVFIIFPASILYKLPIIIAFSFLFLIPITSQFFLPALPILTWLAFYFTCAKIPHSWKPAISVKFLPAMETILYGDNLSNVLASITNRALDILAWLPYGLFHFGAPFVVAALIFLFGPPTSLRSYGFAFGYMNLFGVIIQMLFPAAPPWYKNLYGLQPANYTMHGSPGGLGRIDELLGFDMYTTGFSNSPVIFGAFPSLHSGCCIMEVLFMCWLFPKLKPLFVFYASWLWWSTMYLTHHYFIDLTGGAVLSLLVFEFTKYKYLPKIKGFCRWSYTELNYYNINIDETIYNDNEEEENLKYKSIIYQQPQQYQIQDPLSFDQHDNFEMGNFSRSRQTSKSFVPLISENDDVDSGTGSVFEDENYVGSSKSTSLEDLASPINYINDKSGDKSKTGI
ncbi:AUR1 [Candida pseudojiufengensis]|uniref:AUR1 n=1 Tax=Candida pseudojiufengensis TaxID=497109 RepID=UPI002224499B|nr:AUR1 [Candida pseudojiufengensis]KAI5964324.1 AUR1 [Candida pseudojiufengensis]